MMSPVRTGSPVSGSATVTVPSREMVVCPLQLAPRSGDRSTAMLAPWRRPRLSLAKAVITFTRAPVPSATIWLPIVWSFWPGSKMTRAGSQVAPPLVVREK